MESISNFERMLHDCPEVDCSDLNRFPKVSQEDFLLMEQESDVDVPVANIFPFVQKNNRGTIYIDIYIWDMTLYPERYIRFIILDGYRLSQKLEDIFFEYINSDFIQIDESRMKSMNGEVLRYFPHWQYVNYSVYYLSMAFEHMYCASHPSGVREILYKSKLTNIAFWLDYIPLYNLIGTTPSSIIGHNLSIKLLRILNQPEFLENLFSEESVEHCKAVYKAYSGHIGKTLPTNCQWSYLEKLYDNGGMFAGHGFIRALYDRLSSTWDRSILDVYERFLFLRDELLYIRKLKIPKTEEIGDVVEMLERIKNCKWKHKSYNVMIKNRRKKEDFEYSGKEYSVIMPDSSLDFYMEAFSLGNCVDGYIDDHVSGETTVLFIRRTSAIDKSFVTVEVKDWEIRQVYAKFNSLPPKDVYIFLMEYARNKGLSYDIYKLITGDNNEFEDNDVDIELMEFAEEYRHRTSLASLECTNDEKYVQLTLKDCYPI